MQCTGFLFVAKSVFLGYYIGTEGIKWLICVLMCGTYAELERQKQSFWQSVELDKGRVLLYHGSKSGIEGDIAPKSRKQCDFGKGFYMGTEPSQALTLICDYESAKFYIVSISVDNLAVLDVPADLEWAMIVAYHRGRMEKIKGTLFYSKYQEMTKNKDLVIGSITNDRMFFVIDNFFIGK